MASFELHVNGKTRTVSVRDPDEPLLYVLRNRLTPHRREIRLRARAVRRVHGARRRCKRSRSCTLPVSIAVGSRKITTIEGLGSPDKPHPVQAAFIAEQAAQCGYCTNGMVMTTAALLAQSPNATLDDAKAALAGNLCRCGTHQRILRAVMRAAKRSTA